MCGLPLAATSLCFPTLSVHLVNAKLKMSTCQDFSNNRPTTLSQANRYRVPFNSLSVTGMPNSYHLPSWQAPKANDPGTPCKIISPDESSDKENVTPHSIALSITAPVPRLYAPIAKAALRSILSVGVEEEGKPSES